MLKKSFVYLPDPEREELGCKMAKPSQSIIGKKALITYKKLGQTCYALINKNYFNLKKSSDHLPLFAEIELKN